MTAVTIYVLGVLIAASLIIMWHGNTPKDDRQHYLPLPDLLMTALGSWLTVMFIAKAIHDENND